MNPRDKENKRDKPKKPRHFKRDADSAYIPNPKRHKHKKSASEAASQNVLAMRTDTATMTEAQTPVKTSVLIDSSLFSENKFALDTAHAQFTQQLATIPSYRPVSAIIQFSALGSPLQIITPAKKSVLKRTVKIGPMSHFSSDSRHHPEPTAAQQTELPDRDRFTQSPECQALQTILSDYKLQTTTITPESLESTREAHIKSGRRRPISQQAALAKSKKSGKAASAATHANATDLFSGTMRWEWLHLIAYMILGHASQTASNLVGGTDYANTNMMFIEAEMRYLAEKYPDGFQLQVKANLIPGTHIATQIEYTITTNDFTLPLTFDAQHSVKPHISLRDYMHTLITTLVSLAKNKEAHLGEAEVKEERIPLPFFQRPKQEAASEEKHEEKGAVVKKMK